MIVYFLKAFDTLTIASIVKPETILCTFRLTDASYSLKLRLALTVTFLLIKNLLYPTGHQFTLSLR